MLFRSNGIGNSFGNPNLRQIALSILSLVSRGRRGRDGFRYLIGVCHMLCLVSIRSGLSAFRVPAFRLELGL